jgi:fumarate hydratase subunit alpha
MARTKRKAKVAGKGKAKPKKKVVKQVMRKTSKKPKTKVARRDARAARKAGKKVGKKAAAARVMRKPPARKVPEKAAANRIMKKSAAPATRPSGVREISAKKIADTVTRLSMEANFDLENDVLNALRRGLEREESPVGKEIFNQLLENADIARGERLPICQDTGLAIVFVELGQDAHVTGGSLEDAINEGVRRGYTEGYLRKSVLGDPLKRVNTKDNTPAVIHTRIVPGGKLRLWVVPKGGGSENMSKIAMLKPADGVEGVKKFVIESVRVASANPCPPIIVGVGIGGSFEQCAMNAKRALLREVGSTHADAFYADLEAELLEKVNDLGIGPMGLGGRITALAVHIEVAPCHIASLPVAVNINCHAARHKMAEL